MSPVSYSPSVAYFRNFIFGVEDSLVSTVGLLSGVAVAGMAREVIFTTGLILVLVEAISMAAGSFLSEHSAEEYIKQSDIPARRTARAGAVMFFSYAIAGLIPISPYLLMPVDSALPVSIGLSVIALFILGLVGAKISRTSMLMNGVQMAVVGSVAIAVGVLAGSVISRL